MGMIIIKDTERMPSTTAMTVASETWVVQCAKTPTLPTTFALDTHALIANIAPVHKTTLKLFNVRVLKFSVLTARAVRTTPGVCSRAHGKIIQCQVSGAGHSIH